MLLLQDGFLKKLTDNTLAFLRYLKSFSYIEVLTCKNSKKTDKSYNK